MNIETPLERIGLFVRAGTVLPMETDGKLALHIYSGEGTSQLYCDAGDGYDEARVDKFQLTREKNQLVCNWQGEGNYPFPYPRVQLILHGWLAQRVWCDGVEISMKENRVKVEPFEQIRFEG